MPPPPRPPWLFWLGSFSASGTRWRPMRRNDGVDRGPRVGVALDPTGISGLLVHRFGPARAMAGRPPSSAGNSGQHLELLARSALEWGLKRNLAAESSLPRTNGPPDDARTASERVQRRREAGPLVVGGPVPRAVHEAHRCIWTSTTSETFRHPRTAKRPRRTGFQSISRMSFDSQTSAPLPGVSAFNFHHATRWPARASSALYRGTTGACPGG